MGITIKLYSTKARALSKFLNRFFEKNIQLSNDLIWEHYFENPIESVDLIGVFIDNNESYNINMWISLDEGFFINVTDFNADKIIRYLFERYPN